ATHAIGLPAAGLAPTEATAVIPPVAPEPVTQVVPVTAGVPITDEGVESRRLEEEPRGDKVSNAALLITIAVLLVLLAGLFLWWQTSRDDPIAPTEPTTSESPTPEESEEPEV